MPMAPLLPLTAQQVAVLKSWIDQGANWSSEGAAPSSSGTANPRAGGHGNYKERLITAEDRKWWAFQKPVRHAIPAMTDARWNANPVDAFIKKSLDDKGLNPAPQADRNTLIRRAYLDLIGLLPSPQEVAAFVNDPSPRAYENLIDRRLASAHYGER